MEHHSIFSKDESNYFKKRCKNKKFFIQLFEGDGLEITPQSDHFFFKCCSCGFTHKIVIERNNNNIILKFYTTKDKL